MKQEKTLSLQFAQFVLKRRWWIIALSLVIVFAAFSGGKYLIFNNDSRAFFSEDNPELLAFEKLEANYSGRDENVLIVLGPKNGNVFTRETLAVVEKYTKAAWQVPYSSRVDSVTNFQYSYAEGDDLIIEDLVKNSSKLSHGALKNIRNVAMTEPLLVKRVVSDLGHVTGINITIKLPRINPTSEEPEVVEYVRQLANQIRAENPDLAVHLTGIIMLNNAFGEASAIDMQTLVPLTLLIFLISIALLMRGWTGAFATLWVILFSIMTALGIAGWSGIALTSISASAPTIIITLAIANAIHVLVSLVHGMQQGHNKKNAMLESIRINLQPIFLVSFTTMLGFLTMNFSESPPFHALGNIVAIGVIAAFVFSLTFLPALMMVLPVRAPKIKTENNNLMEKLAEFVIRYQNKLLLGMGTIFILLVSFLPNNDLNDEWIQYFDESLEFRQATDYTTKNMTGFYRIDYSLNANGTDGISDPDFLNKVKAFKDWYELQPEVVQVTALTDIMTRLNKNMHGDDPVFATIPDSRELAAQYLLLYEMSLPYGLDLNNQINMEKSATRVTVTTRELSVNQTLELEQRAQSWLKQNAPSIQSPGTGNTIMFAHIGVRNIKSMLLGTSIALILISGILIVAFRSVRIGLLSIVPNVMPGLMGFGLWGLLVGEIGMGLATVAGVTMGIVVDDTVHFLSKYLRARREKGLNSEDAVRYAFSTVGTALWFTSLVLIAGFSVLAFSTFKMNADMGLLTAVTIALALLADFLFLPPLLIKLDSMSEKSTQKILLTNINPEIKSRPIIELSGKT